MWPAAWSGLGFNIRLEFGCDFESHTLLCERALVAHLALPHSVKPELLSYS